MSLTTRVRKYCLLETVTKWKKAFKQFNCYMNPEECQVQLNKIEQKARLFLNAKNQKDPYFVPNVFLNLSLSWLCHGVDRKLCQDLWCLYYWHCFPTITWEKEQQTETEKQYRQ
jgi:hypothetical protein